MSVHNIYDALYEDVDGRHINGATPCGCVDPPSVFSLSQQEQDDQHRAMLEEIYAAFGDDMTGIEMVAVGVDEEEA